MNRLVALFLACSACASAAGSIVLTHSLVAMLPTGEVAAGSGSISSDAQARLDASARAALVEAARGSVAAADHYPNELRLQRRAAAMIRAVATERAVEPAAIERVLARLAATPCPGLADVAATRESLGDASAAGDLYLRAARECDSVDAAIAAVAPLRQVDRCDDAIAALREAWPHVDRRKRGATVPLLDAVASCSDSLNLRSNLAFVPAEVVADYLALLDARQRAEDEAAARADEERREREAEDRARDAASRCESECSAGGSTCTSSCQGEPQCVQRCSSVYHVCRAGCGAP